MRPVNATLQATGTVQPASSATVSFPISGTVATVPVSVGSTVSAGSVLATVDGTALSLALAQAKSTLAQAKLTLEQDENGTGRRRRSRRWRFFTAAPVAGTGLSVPAAQRAVQEAELAGRRGTVHCGR